MRTFIAQTLITAGIGLCAGTVGYFGTTAVDVWLSSHDLKNRMVIVEKADTEAIAQRVAMMKEIATIQGSIKGIESDIAIIKGLLMSVRPVNYREAAHHDKE